METRGKQKHPIKICYVLSTSDITGGANRSIIELLKSIDRNIIDPKVLIRRHGDIERVLNSLGIPYAFIPYANAVKIRSPIKDFLKMIMPHFNLKAVEKYLKENDIDIVHNNSVPVRTGMEAAYHLGIPYICHIRERVREGLHTEFLNPKKHQNLINNATVIIAISDYIRKGYQLDEGRTIIINDGIDIETYCYEKTIMQRENIQMSIYGGLNSQKGQFIAIKAMELLQKRGYSNVYLNIVGDSETEYGQKAKDYVYENRINNISFKETIKDLHELRNSRSLDDINLICSNAEGLGRVTIESMLSNSLTIAANAGATPEIIKDKETGLLYNVDDPESLEKTIRYALANKEQMRIIANQGKSYAIRHFDISQYTRRIMDIYEYIISEKEMNKFH